MAQDNAQLANELQNLRTKTVNTMPELDIRKTLVGGLDPKEVGKYIKMLIDQSQRAESAYKERLEEFASFSEMLTRERDELADQLEQEKRTQIRYKEALIKQQDEQNQLGAVVEELKRQLDEYIETKDDAVVQQNTELLEQNKRLMTQLEELAVSRDFLAGENAVLANKLGSVQDGYNALQVAYEELLVRVAGQNADMTRRYMQVNMHMYEYAQKQGYVMDKTMSTLNGLISELYTMKKEMLGLQDTLRTDVDMTMSQDVKEHEEAEAMEQAEVPEAVLEDLPEPVADAVSIEPEQVTQEVIEDVTEQPVDLSVEQPEPVFAADMAFEQPEAPIVADVVSEMSSEPVVADITAEQSAQSVITDMTAEKAVEQMIEPPVEQAVAQPEVQMEEKLEPIERVIIEPLALEFDIPIVQEQKVVGQ